MLRHGLVLISLIASPTYHELEAGLSWCWKLVSRLRSLDECSDSLCGNHFHVANVRPLLPLRTTIRFPSIVGQATPPEQQLGTTVAGKLFPCMHVLRPLIHPCQKMYLGSSRNRVCGLGIYACNRSELGANEIAVSVFSKIHTANLRKHKQPTSVREPILIHHDAPCPRQNALSAQAEFGYCCLHRGASTLI